ncbi:hypothetical protein NIES4071_68210 [Calothrix sp. NIES-4071]|nr:hypothetical protein NIES4071_68210 [Calothrix sp. NIES-4071]BAZ61099.1 hypothetical protein NIES4105_68170 [Calothrix sp. NIES-4105]
MSYFFSLRGWLEVEPEKFDKATQLIESLQRTYEQDTKIGLYLQGWSWNRNPFKEETRRLGDALTRGYLRWGLNPNAR